MKDRRLAVIGATGLVGQTVLKVLEEKNLPITEYGFFASHKSAGKKIMFLQKEYMIQELDEHSFDYKFDFAIFCAGSDVAKKFVPIAVSKGCIVIDNSSYFRMFPDVPLIVPEVNFEDSKNHQGIIANPNCSTIQAMVALKPLYDTYGINRIVYNTYQAVSGGGMSAVMDLKKGIFSNCLPHIDVFLENGYTKEEEKMINESRKILKNPNLKITATTVRVPILNGHSESINVELKKDFILEELKQILQKAPGIMVKDDPSNAIYPTVLDVNHQDKVYVGRIRRDFSIPYGVNLWVVADNLRKGAASNAVQILERLL